MKKSETNVSPTGEIMLRGKDKPQVYIYMRSEFSKSLSLSLIQYSTLLSIRASIIVISLLP